MHACVHVHGCLFTLQCFFKTGSILLITVLAFYLETDKDLMEVIRAATLSKKMNFSQLFSRNKMLRRKLNRRLRKQTSN